ncbi:MAG: hypothetical protein ABI604_19895, partial [Nitrospirota bacterium]
SMRRTWPVSARSWARKRMSVLEGVNRRRKSGQHGGKGSEGARAVWLKGMRATTERAYMLVEHAQNALPHPPVPAAQAQRSTAAGASRPETFLVYQSSRRHGA